MNSEQKRLVVLLVIAIGGAVFLFYDRQRRSSGITASAPQLAVKPIEIPLTPPVAIPKPSVSTAPDSLPLASNVTDTDVKVEREWGGDPFQPPEDIELVKSTPGTSRKQREIPPPKVTNILIKGSQRVVTMNGRNFSVGDMIGEENVEEILHDRVVLSKGKLKREIYLEGGTISVVKKLK